MKLSPPSSYQEVARKMAAAWVKGGGNFILVAPPLSFSEHIFRLLRDQSFQEECGLDTDTLVIASLSPSSYNSSEEFVRKVLKFWEVEDVFDTQEYDELELLGSALESLQAENKTPIILLPQFHKTVKKLSWKLGAKLRELEFDYGLCTVVEVPVPLSQLRSRWEVQEGTETFICSDFGQGHSTLKLKGFSLHEIRDIVEKANLKPEYVQVIGKWSGGIPELVNWLISLSSQCQSTKEVEHVARAGSLEQCTRFINWLDALGSKQYRELAAEVWQGTAAVDDTSVLRQHEWGDLLIDDGGNFKSDAIGFACANFEGPDLTQSLSRIGKAIRANEVEQTNSLVKGLSDAFLKDQEVKQVVGMTPLWASARTLSPDWRTIKQNSIFASKLLKNSTHPKADLILKQVKRWQDFSNGISKMEGESKRNEGKDWRLADGLSGRGEENDYTSASVQLILYRLSEAQKASDADANSALKSALEIPEQILQIYCGRKLDISVWSAPKFDTDEIEEVQRLWQQGDYRIPSEGARLSLSDLIYFGWVRMQRQEVHNRLFETFNDFKEWSKIYEQVRNEATHSIKLVYTEEWKKFYASTKLLADRLSLSLTSEKSEVLLPDLSVVLLSVISEKTGLT
jgi:hypothetical protein